MTYCYSNGYETRN